MRAMKMLCAAGLALMLCLLAGQVAAQNSQAEKPAKTEENLSACGTSPTADASLLLGIRQFDIHD